MDTTTNTNMDTTMDTTTNSTDTAEVTMPSPTRARSGNLALTALVGAGALLLGACGASDEDASAAGDVAAAAEAPAEAAAAPDLAQQPVGIDGLAQYAAIDPGTYDLGSLGTPVTVTVEGDWWVQPNVAGHTVFSHPDSSRPGDRDVVLLRPTLLADPTQPGAPMDVQQSAPLDDIEGWLDSVVDGIVTTDPQQVEIGGRSAVYFEAEITDSELCGATGYCAGFIINTMTEDSVSGWSFEPWFHQRVWWIDGGDHEPLVIMANTTSSARDFQAQADELIATLEIGESAPHPASNPGT